MLCWRLGGSSNEQQRIAARRAYEVFGLSLLCVAGLLSGCRGARNEAEIAGAYELKADWGCAKLELRPDHTFTQTVMDGCVEKDAKVLQGKWDALELGTKASRVHFAPYIRVGARGASGIAGEGSAGIEKGPLSDLAIAVSPDDGLEYVKTH